ncbi:serine hydrolase domain-containing protein [Desertimonas flava]|uniref:serine hydrolase domain-containing protein n=1 Tax=Desertimonas flava TaxID=2064846 RepID=UPI000E349073|nr:serine hydrolase domain-containing protein [Desertimonas flava]
MELGTRADIIDLDETIGAVVADQVFSGVVRVDVDGEVHERVYGLADRAHDIPVTAGHRFGLASGAKPVTALTVVRLAQDGVLPLDTTARSLLGDDLPLVADDVTVEQLLAHRSGIGDYLDEDEIEDFAEPVLSRPVHQLYDPETYLPLIDGYPTAFPAGSAFAYNNGGYVLLALLAERAAGESYYDLVDRLVLQPAGMTASGFLRLDRLTGDVATGYIHPDDHPDRLRVNTLHLPVRGCGDGGLYSTVADIRSFWTALFAGAIVDDDWRQRMHTPLSDADRLRYGLGFWVPRDARPWVRIHGGDAGVSFVSVHDPSRDLTHTVISNWTDGAWPVSRELSVALGTALD